MKRSIRFLLIATLPMIAILFSTNVFAQKTQSNVANRSLLACGIPSNLVSTNIAPTSATVSWTSVSGANRYVLQYRISGVATWTSISTTTKSKSLVGLVSSTLYEYQVQSICGSGSSDFSSTVYFSTMDPCVSPGLLTAVSVNATTENLGWANIPGIMYYNFRYRVTGTTSWTTDSSITNSKTISGLIVATSYDYQVQTRCTPGILSPYGATSNFTTINGTAFCGVATMLSATSITTSSAALGWSAVSGAINYTIQYRVSGTTAWTSTSSVTASKAISGLIAATLYEFQVQTVCTTGTSAFSASGTFTTTAAPCTVATGLSSASITTTGATVSWTAVSGATSYNVQYRVSGTTAWTNAASTTTSLALTGLTSATLYEIQVQTVCTTGTSAFSASGTFTTSAAPCTVATGLASASITTTGATVSWTAVSGATSYNVQYRVSGATAWTSTTSATTSLALTGLTSATLYEFQVQTVCATGTSAFSASGTFTTTSAPCTVPTGLTSASITPTGATLSWTAVSGSTSYNVQYRVSGTTTWTTIATTAISKAITGLSSATLYEFQVQTVCTTGTSAFTASSTFTTTAAPCTVATGLTSAAITTTGATLSWTAVSGATSYNVQYRVSGTTTWTSTTTSTTTSILTGLSSATLYEFQVQTVCTTGTSSFSVSGTFTTTAAPCTVAIGLASASITTTGATLSWTAVSGATSYNVQYRVSGTTTWTSTTTSTTSLTLTGLISATLYEFQVQTVCATGTSLFSASGTFTTTAAPCTGATGLASASITTTGATISWTAVSGATSYNVQYRVSGTTTWTSTTSTTTSKAITGLTSATLYEFQVQTVCTTGTSAFSASSTFTTTAVACGVADINLFGTINITSATATVYWTAVSGALSYNVQYRVFGTTTAWSTVSTTAATANLSGLAATTKYEFQVQTICSGGSGAFSASGVFTTIAYSCGVPVSTSFTTTGITSSAATVNWSAVTGAVGYKVQYRVNGSGAAWSFLSVTLNSGTITGLASSTVYEFQVQTNCTSGTSAFSASGTFTTSASSCGLTNVAMFTATNTTASSCTVGWSAVTGATSYNVQYRIKLTAGAWSTISSSGITANLTGLTSATQYEFQVQTVCTSGTSAFTTSGIFTTLTVTTCGVPSGAIGGAITSTSATLNWTAVSGASSYAIQYRKTGVTSWTSGTSTINSFGLVGLLAATAYQFQVQTICSGGSSAFSSTASFTTNSTGSVALPVPDHVVVVVFENHAYQQIIGNSAAPHINAFAGEASTTLFTQSYAIEHPSQPNYLDLFAGGNQGVTNNNLPAAHFTSMNLAKALLNVGRTFKYYSEDLPSIGWDGETSAGYARKHNALANWMGTGTNQVSTALNLPMTSFPTDFTTLPTVSFVSPNLTNSMHDGTGNAAITVGDNWFYTKIYPYVVWARTHNSLLIFTFDEDDNVSANRVATIFSGQMVTAGQNATGVNHYNLLRTIEDMYGTAHSGNAASAAPIHGCWTNGYRISNKADVKEELNLSVYPNPTSTDFNISYTLNESSVVSIRLMDMVGKVIIDDVYAIQEAGHYDLALSVETLNLKDGIYFMEMIVNGQRTIKKLVVDKR